MEMMLCLILIPTFFAAPTTGSTLVLSGCSTTCGNITIPYPFGIEPGCHRDGFNLTCDRTKNPPKLLLGDGTVQVINISLVEGIVRVKSNVLAVPRLQSGNMTTRISEEGPYSLSYGRTRLTAIGCYITVKIADPTNAPFGMCASVCVLPNTFNTSLCSGVGCCQTSVPFATRYFEIDVSPINGTNGGMVANQNYVFLVEQDWFENNFGALQTKYDPFADTQVEDHDSLVIPFILDWSLGQYSLSCDYYKNNDSNYGCFSENSLCYTAPSKFPGYRCKCTQGFAGNPYVLSGCQDIDECDFPNEYVCYGACINELGTYRCICPDGTHWVNATSCMGGSINKKYVIAIGIGTGIALLIVVLGVLTLIKRIKAMRLKITRERWFKLNHGLLLQQLISSNEYIGERMKIFSLTELEKATNKFDASRIVGRGGHGIVYKGILSDRRVVAIKKSHVVVQSEIDQFINELAILSQVDHRNVVKLYGCCLESQVPLLVYEFISNGTLFNHLHAETGYHFLSWEDRFRIAVEVSRALAHLHSTASISIFHRDVKSSNILLDDYLTVKVSDFGASRLIQIDQNSITTAVQGTFGYLDPEYFYTGRLTEKSDVYSFGVILAELLTREKPTSSSRFQQGENLAAYFCTAIRGRSFNDIVDPEITKEENRAEIETVAIMAETCLKLRGEERPTMKVIETKLQVLNESKQKRLYLHPRGEERVSERESLVNNQFYGGDITFTRQFSLENELISSSRNPR